MLQTHWTYPPTLYATPITQCPSKRITYSQLLSKITGVTLPKLILSGPRSFLMRSTFCSWDFFNDYIFPVTCLRQRLLWLSNQNRAALESLINLVTLSGMMWVTYFGDTFLWLRSHVWHGMESRRRIKMVYKVETF